MRPGHRLPSFDEERKCHDDHHDVRIDGDCEAVFGGGKAAHEDLVEGAEECADEDEDGGHFKHIGAGAHSDDDADHADRDSVPPLAADVFFEHECGEQDHEEGGSIAKCIDDCQRSHREGIHEGVSIGEVDGEAEDMALRMLRSEDFADAALEKDCDKKRDQSCESA